MTDKTNRDRHHINIDPIKQQSSKDCAVACMQMVLGYFERTVDAGQLQEEFIHDSTGGTFLTELARYAQNQGLACQCFAYNLYLTDP